MAKTLYVISKCAEYGNLKPEGYASEEEARKALKGLYIDCMCDGDIDNDSEYDNGFRVVYTNDGFIECELFEVEIE